MTAPDNKALISRLRKIAVHYDDAAMRGHHIVLTDKETVCQAADALEAAAAREAQWEYVHEAAEARIARLEAVAEAARLVSVLSVLPWAATNIDNDEADRRQAALCEALAALEAK